MHILVHFDDPAERDALCALLRGWASLSCVAADIVCDARAVGEKAPLLVFWDMDGPDQPPQVGREGALFLCARDPRRAIESYRFHPADLLIKPVTAERLWQAMRRCARLWVSSLERLEVASGRLKLSFPMGDLLWAEGHRRGCLLHTVHDNIPARVPLYQLEKQLPSSVFARCQRKFLVNLTQVDRIEGNALFLRDGTKLTLSRTSKSEVLTAYQQVRQTFHPAEGYFRN